MKCSICIATVPGKAPILKKVLGSIDRQRPGFEFEVIVVHDDYGSYRNSAIARNKAMKQAQGDVLILQSDDVVHRDSDTIERLVNDLEPTEFLLATVFNVNHAGQITATYVSPDRPKRRFFLGSVFQKYIFQIGGHSEDFPEPGCEDDWLGDCLEHGLGLTPTFTDGIVGLHQDHPRPDLAGPHERMRAIRRRKAAEARIDPSKWIGGPAWPIPTA